MRYVIYGAGAIGGVIAARLHAAGLEVHAIARGEHLRQMRTAGLLLQTPEGESHLAIPASETPDGLELEREDVVLLTMKSQDTAAALERLSAHADPGVAVVCAQNGIENERQALRRFRHSYGMFVYLTAEHLEPGIVRAFSSPTPGVLDVGLVPCGLDKRARQIAADLETAGFSARAVADIMRWKHAKLLANMVNAPSAVTASPHYARELSALARAEAIACLQAAGLDFAGEREVAERVSVVSPTGTVAGRQHTGSSTAQSLARGSSRTEVDYLNGEIVLLGRQHGVPTPVNAALQRALHELAAARARPGSIDYRERIEAELSA